MTKSVKGVLYLCDRKACGDTCPNDECRHTQKWVNALHKDADPSRFTRVPVGDGALMLVEPDDD